MRSRAKRLGASAVLFALLGAVLLLMAPGTGQAICVPSSPTPTPATSAGYTWVNLPDGGKAWITSPSGQLNGQTGAAGQRGFIRAQGNASTMSGEIRGHSKDAPLNGSISGSASGGPRVVACITVANQPDVKATIP